MATAKSALRLRQNLSGWLTRAQVSDLMGIAIDTIRQWERQGRLHPAKTINPETLRETIVYDPQELARIPHRRTISVAAKPPPGECTARAFELFNLGKTTMQIVIELRMTVGEVEEIHQQWLDLGGSEIVIGPESRAKLEACLGSFTTAEELAQRIEEISAIAAIAASGR